MAAGAEVIKAAPLLCRGDLARRIRHLACQSSTGPPVRTKRGAQLDRWPSCPRITWCSTAQTCRGIFLCRTSARHRRASSTTVSRSTATRKEGLRSARNLDTRCSAITSMAGQMETTPTNSWVP